MVKKWPCHKTRNFKNQKRPKIKNVKRPEMLLNEKFEDQEVQPRTFEKQKET